jgi:hypothetical protein
MAQAYNRLNSYIELFLNVKFNLKCTMLYYNSFIENKTIGITRV